MADIDLLDLTVDVAELRKKYPAVCARYLKRALKEEITTLARSSKACRDVDESDNSCTVLPLPNTKADRDMKEMAPSEHLLKNLQEVMQEAEEVRRAMDIIKSNRKYSVLLYL